MINFIVCDDNEIFRKNIEKVITDFMVLQKIDYKIYVFPDYDSSFNKVISNNMSSKIYILDIETPTRSGIDIARIIREKDLESVIIFLTSHEELGITILKNDLICLSFINKYDDYENRLNSSLKKALTIMNKKLILRFDEKGVLYTIDANDILYITRDSVDRKSIFKMDYAEYKFSISLHKVKNMLDENFIQTHRSCLINKNKIASVDKVSNVITFKNGEVVSLLSHRYKKEFM